MLFSLCKMKNSNDREHIGGCPDTGPVREAIRRSTDTTDPGFLREPGVNVLSLNLALDQSAPRLHEPFSASSSMRFTISMWVQKDIESKVVIAIRIVLLIGVLVGAP